MALLHLAAGLLDRDRLLRDQDDVGSARDAAVDGDPARVPAHHLDDHHPVVRLGRRVQPVDRLRRDRHGRVESECVVRRVEVVVDRLRHADDRELVLGIQPRGDAQRVLAADRDERVQTRAGGVLEHPFDTALDLVRVCARRPENRAAAGENPRDLPAPERLDDPLDEPAPTLAHADDLPAAVERAPRYGPDDSVQARAVTAPREDADSLRHGRSLPRRAGSASLQGSSRGCNDPSARASGEDLPPLSRLVRDAPFPGAPREGSSDGDDERDRGARQGR